MHYPCNWKTNDPIFLFLIPENFPDKHFPIGHLSARQISNILFLDQMHIWWILPRVDKFGRDTASTRHILDGPLLNQKHYQRTFPLPGKCPRNNSSIKHISNGHFSSQTNARETFPWLHASHNGHFFGQLST